MRICKYYDAVGIVTGIVFSCDLSFFPLPMNIPNDNHAVVADDELCVCDESECESFRSTTRSVSLSASPSPSGGTTVCCAL